MGKHFIRISKKTRFSVFITAVVLGLGVGIIAVSALIAFFKLLGNDVPLLYYILCAALVPVTFALTYIIARPSDKRLAKRLDTEHALDEKVRTMVEFKNSDDPFARLQREDADEKLGTLKIKFWRKKQIVAIILVAVISVGAFTGAAFVPEKVEVIPPEEPISEFDKQWIIAAINDLIATVDKSLMTETHKEISLEELRSLVAFVEGHSYMSEMKIEAISAVIDINSSLKNVNSAPQIGEALSNCQTPLLVQLGKELVNMSGKTQQCLKDIKDEIEKVDGLDAVFVADEISAVLKEASLNRENTLVKQLSNLSSALIGYSNEVLTLDAAFGNLPFELSNEVMIQNINRMTTQTVISELCNIFGISPDDLANVEGGENIDTRPPSEIQPDEEVLPDVEDPDKPIDSGGLGTGDRIYASNDVIYDPYSNSYVIYGQLLDEYNARATDKILDGQITEDFVKFIEEYFKSLSEYKPTEA